MGGNLENRDRSARTWERWGQSPRRRDPRRQVEAAAEVEVAAGEEVAPEMETGMAKQVAEAEAGKQPE